LRASDERTCNMFFDRLDVCDLRMRYPGLRFSMHYFLPMARGESRNAAFAAFDAGDAMVGVVNVVGVNSDSSELAVIVRSDYKRRGIGSALIAHAIQWGEENGLARLFGLVLAENWPMRALARVMGFQSVGSAGLLIELSRSITARHAQR
jgi:acetyltransferase